MKRSIPLQRRQMRTTAFFSGIRRLLDACSHASLARVGLTRADIRVFSVAPHVPSFSFIRICFRSIAADSLKRAQSLIGAE
jgi:hypothetical protein